MLSCASLIRLIRRRLVLGLIFALSLTYCAFSLFRNEKKGSLNLDSDFGYMDPMINDNNDLLSDDNMLPEELRAPGKPSLWQIEMLDRTINDKIKNADISNLNESDASTQSCRNSIQGKGLIVDERGLVCSRHEVLSNGCCTVEQRQNPKNNEASSVTRRERYSCKTCNLQGCCTIYEYCVSCCLHPDKPIQQIRGRKDMLLGLAKTQKDEEKMRIRGSQDRFNICLAVCRTSSSSVRHENTYKDPFSKHCYAPQPLNSHQRHRRNINSLNNNGDNHAVVVTSSSVVTLLTHLSPECHSSYRLSNESHIFFHVNVVCVGTTLALPDYYSHLKIYTQ